MLRDITIGQYYPVNSIVHKLDARVKIFCVFVFVISLFLFGNPVSYCLATAVLIIAVYFSKVPFKYIIRGLKSVFVLLVFTVVLNLFLTKGEVIVQIWKLTITKEGIIFAIHISVRIIYLIIASSLLTLTTTPTRLTDALEKSLSPLNKIKVPVHEFAMMMSIAIRFIPILVEETDKLMKTQSARCMNFEKGNIFRRIKNMAKLFIPLFISAIRRANDLALAMEARCYQGGQGRTKMKVLKYDKKDLYVYIAGFLYLITLFVLNLLI